jgi:hypothetical protein
LEIKNKQRKIPKIFFEKLCSQKKLKKTGFKALCSQPLFSKNSGSHILKLDILKMSKKKNRPHFFFEILKGIFWLTK